MVMVFLAVLSVVLMLAGCYVWIHAGAFIVANWIPLALALAAMVAVVCWRLRVIIMEVEELSATQSGPAPATVAEWHGGAEGWTKTHSSDDGKTVVWELSDEVGPTPATSASEQTEVAFWKGRVQEEIRAKWKANQLVLDDNTCRLSGRVARIDKKSEEAAYGTLWLAILDRGGDWQAVKLQGAFQELVGVSETDQVTLLANWQRGRLTWFEVESRAACDEPMPEVTLPEPKGAETSKQDGQLPTLAELDKASREGGWGSLNHSVFSFNVPVHITCSPKRRAKSFEGKGADVQGILRTVAEAEGLRVIAVAAEGDHIHMVGIPAGSGGQPPTWVWSKWVGRWKALTSKKLKDLPELEDFQWQTGYSLNAVHGGKRGAETALAIVRRYVEAQGDQGAAETGGDTEE